MQSFIIQLQKNCQHLTNWMKWNKRDKVWSNATSLLRWRCGSRRRPLVAWALAPLWKLLTGPDKATFVIATNIYSSSPPLFTVPTWPAATRVLSRSKRDNPGNKVGSKDVACFIGGGGGGGQELLSSRKNEVRVTLWVKGNEKVITNLSTKKLSSIAKTCLWYAYDMPYDYITKDDWQLVL